MTARVDVVAESMRDKKFWSELRLRLVGDGHEGRPILIAMRQSENDVEGNSAVGGCVRCQEAIWVPEAATKLLVAVIKVCRQCFTELNDEILAQPHTARA